MNAIVPHAPTGVDHYRQSTDAASVCKAIVVETAMEIQGRKYVKVEGWQAIAIAHGCVGSARDVEHVEGGYRSVGEVRRMSDGQIIAEAEGFVGEDEPTWFGGETVTKWGKKVLPKRPDYAIRAMAQTRAISRACRSAFAHVVVMMNAGLSTTPFEEVPLEGFEDGPRPVAQEPPAPKKASAAQLKRDGEDARIKAEINACDLAGIAEWEAEFDARTSHLPTSWLDPIRDMIELRKEELLAPEPEGAADMDAAFRETMGPPVSDNVAGRDTSAFKVVA